MKKVFLTVLVAVCAIFALSLTTAASGPDSDVKKHGALTYCIYYYDDKAEIIACDESVTEVTIPPEIGGYTVTSISGSAFSGCSSLESLTIPDSVTSISNRAFRGCSSLTSVTIGNGVKSIGKRAFRGCSSLTSITIPDSVTSIGDYAFSDCSSLTSVTIGNGVTSIGESAFRGCDSLTSVTLPIA